MLMTLVAFTISSFPTPSFSHEAYSHFAADVKMDFPQVVKPYEKLSDRLRVEAISQAFG